jgi:hypothetical protein
VEPFVNGALAFIGLGVVLASVTGLTLPAGERLSGVLALAVGGGTGVTALAVGTLLVDATTGDSEAAYERVFFVASALGFVAVAISSAMARRTASREARRSAGETPTT